ncbi:head-tail connector protein [Orbus wheelerorum]|uniref:head-tail connector protein n=1 Tax=Orbus wheelerorum TaxID=3074111 RepID=UPI00370D0A48
MKFPTIEELKLQCRIDYSDEDSLLDMYLKAAINRAETRLNRKLYEDSIPEDKSNGIVVNAEIKMALILAVNHFYDSRNAAKIPTGFYELIDPYRVIPL